MYAYLYLRNLLNDIQNREEGQDLIEYALIVVLIVIVTVGALTLLGDRITEIWEEITIDLGG